MLILKKTVKTKKLDKWEFILNPQCPKCNTTLKFSFVVHSSRLFQCPDCGKFFREAEGELSWIEWRGLRGK